MFQTLLRAGAVAAPLALFGAFAPANAAPVGPALELANGASAVQEAGYRYRRYYQPDTYVQGNYGNYRPDGAEYRELQRLFPETNWPPSLRYYERGYGY
jgi:hypothetical protein